MSKITVIVPIHHVSGSFLDQCLSSLCLQTFKDFEAILVLNDATSKEQTISQNFCDKDPRFKLFKIDIADVSTARNVGLEYAQGKYIIFLDCDDWFSEDALQKLYNLMETSLAEIGIANTQKIWDNEKKQILFKFYDHEEDVLLKRIPNVAVWGFIFKKDIIKNKHIRFQEGLKLSEDRVFLFEYYLYCKRIAFTNDVVYFYRQHNASVCNVLHTHEHAIQQIKAATALHEILAKSPEYSKKDIEHSDRILTRMGMVAYINSGTTKDGIKQLRDFFLTNISESNIIFYYCWYRAKISAFIGRLLHL
ncbi:glycosyltransferase family 2 protein [Fibrobacter intestinalis]|uniref:Glycosyl transferase family 2 n=1 Tax=Fibrobacter intestinalis TaxID=28122 RepID=A0A1T4K2G2_9BACT|nr:MULTISPECIES: glycosyltransferase [Fibrobacter]PBC74235.1 glycosyl transferase family 2 [Fibrobacter sp. NR9]SJZ36650.1 Glycosyl transferase family 2 [Fibrobacter intestinalis]